MIGITGPRAVHDSTAPGRFFWDEPFNEGQAVSTMGLRSKLIATIFVAALVTGAHCVRAAAVNEPELIAAEPSSSLLLPAELDPVFQQKLVLRVRGPYERSHSLGIWASGK